MSLEDSLTQDLVSLDSGDGHCPLCSSQGRFGQLVEYYVSLDESITLCNNGQCCYLMEDDAATPSPVDSLSSALPVLQSCASDQLFASSLDALQLSEQQPTAAPKKTFDPQSICIMLWMNIDALCWLDVLLCVVCHSRSVRRAALALPYTSIVKKLILTFDEAQDTISPLQRGDQRLLQSVLHLSGGCVKKGGGVCFETPAAIQEAVRRSAASISPQAIDSTQRKLNLAHVKMECVREEVWQYIEPLLKCPRGKDNSPVIALPMLLNLEADVASLYASSYSTLTECKNCCSKSSNSFERVPIVNVPKPPVAGGFHQGLAYKTSCERCSQPVTVSLSVTRFSSHFVVHYAEGFTEVDFDSLGFGLPDGRKYQASAIVEYKSSPSHFALWQRDPNTESAPGKWMLYDDMISQYGQFTETKVSIPPQNVHIIFWECVSSPVAHPQPNMTTAQATLHVPTRPTHNPTAVHLDRSPTTTTSVHKPSDVSAQRRVDGPPQPAPEIQTDSNVSQSAVVATPLFKPLSASKKPAVKLCGNSTASAPPQTSRATMSSMDFTRLMSSSVGTSAARGFSQAKGHNPSSTLSRDYVKPLAGNQKHSAKSYLDLVKPLIDKNKQKKTYAGYVPKSQRKSDGEVRQKKVMFTKDTRSQPTTPTGQLSNNIQQQQQQPTAHNLAPDKPDKSKRRRVSAINNDRPFVAPPVEPPPPVPINADCDMPQLDDLLDIFSL